MNDTQSTGNKNVNNYKLEVDQLRQQIAALPVSGRQVVRF
jgi:hypothetical protein